MNYSLFLVIFQAVLVGCMVAQIGAASTGMLVGTFKVYLLSTSICDQFR
jgi:hypothetical protein